MVNARANLAHWMSKVATGDVWSVADALDAIPQDELRADAELSAFRDMVEELIRSREAFADYNRGLEQAVLEEIEGERDRALLAEARATAASRAKSRFLANVSHELRTPLNVILGYTEMLAEDITEPEHVTDLGRVLVAANHLLSLIDDVLDVSRIEAGHTRVVLEEVNLAAVAMEVVDALQGSATRNGNHLRIDVSPHFATIVTDELKVRQTLLNLVSNACKFTERGSITIECVSNADWVAVSVVDTGRGMASEQVEIAFEEFAQVGPKRTTGDAGSGLGLAISRRLCRLLGGDLTATSELGVGSVFTITLPTTPPPIVATPRHAPDRSDDGRQGALTGQPTTA